MVQRKRQQTGLSPVPCIRCHSNMYPKINFQPISISLTHVQIRGMTIGHVSCGWTCIPLNGVFINLNWKKLLLIPGAWEAIIFLLHLHQVIQSRGQVWTGTWRRSITFPFSGRLLQSGIYVSDSEVVIQNPRRHRTITINIVFTIRHFQDESFAGLDFIQN